MTVRPSDVSSLLRNDLKEPLCFQRRKGLPDGHPRKMKSPLEEVLLNNTLAQGLGGTVFPFDDALSEEIHDHVFLVGGSHCHLLLSAISKMSILYPSASEMQGFFFV